MSSIASDRALVAERGASGFRNLMAHELATWSNPRRWLIQALIAVGVINGNQALVLFVAQPMAQAQGSQMTLQQSGPAVFFGLAFLVAAIDIIIMMQGAIVGEKQSGTAEWILSKPVSRNAYILSKLLGNAVGTLLLVVLLPALVSGILLRLAGLGITSGYWVGVAFLALHTLFYLALTVMLGALFKSRGPVMGIALGSLLGGSVLVSFVGRITLIMPWPLNELATAAALGGPMPTDIWLCPICTIIWTGIAIYAAVRAFNRAEL